MCAYYSTRISEIQGFQLTGELPDGRHIWLMTEFTSEGACETLVAEFLALRPTHMDVSKFLEKAAEYLQRIRDTEDTSLPKTYDDISDTPLQSRPFLLEHVQNVTCYSQ
jgi:hypothetical protein